MFIDCNLTGQEALPELSREMASNEDWKDIDSEEEDRLMTQFCDHRASQHEKKVTKVSNNFAANDIKTKTGWLDTEVSQFFKTDHCPIYGRAAEEPISM